tara:strand:+ start:858 stop:2300 length:1443 start_codon:yes stop_codon:yes gene_type:complete
MVRAIHFVKKNLFFSALYVLVAFTFYRFLYYQLEHVDEVNYLSDSILLFEGILPSFKHSPSGLSTWIGSVYLFFEFIIYSIFNEFPTTVRDLLENIDYIIFSNYLDLTNIKSTLFLLNLCLIFYLYKQDHSNKYFFYIFIIIFFSPYLINLSFSGKPYFTASLFCALAFSVKNKNIRLSHIFYGLALAEKFEFILLINFFASENNKINLKNYLFILIVFFAVAPWWTASFFQNIKINLHYILDNSVVSEDGGKSLLNSIIFLIYFFGLFFVCFLKKYSHKLIIISLLFFSMLHLIVLQNYYLRWFQPFFVYFAFYISSLNSFSKIVKKGEKIIFTIPIIFLIFLHTSKIESDLQILKLEKNTPNKQVLSYGLLKEDLDFKDYINEQIPNFSKRNIKNINHFNDLNSPLSFSVSGNIEISFIRRYEFIAKYHSSEKSKFVLMGGGIPSYIEFWCKKTYMDDKTEIIAYTNKKERTNCSKFK